MLLGQVGVCWVFNALVPVAFPIFFLGMVDSLILEAFSGK